MLNLAESGLDEIVNHDKIEDGIFIGGTIHDVAYRNGILYVGILKKDEHDITYLPCGKKTVLIEGNSLHYSDDVVMLPYNKPEEFTELVSRHMKQYRMLGIYEEGTLASIAFAGGWCWDEA